MPRLIDISGDRYGSWRVLSEHKQINGNTHWLCRCGCGQTQFVSSTNLRRGQSQGCHKCGVKKRSGDNHGRWSGFEKIPGQLWTRIQHAAQRRKIKFDITIEQAWHKFVSQGERCAISGVSISFAPTYSSRSVLQTASLDRIDSSLGYTLDNVQWVHKTVNLMKHTLSDDEMIAWCRKIVENQLAEVG